MFLFFFLFACLFFHVFIKTSQLLYIDTTRTNALILAKESCHVRKYRNIPKINPRTYIFQRPFLRGLFLERLIFGGAYLRREVCVSKSIGLAL